MNKLLKTFEKALDENVLISKVRMAASTWDPYRRKSEQIKKMRIEGNFKLKNMLLAEVTTTDLELLVVKLCAKYKAKTINEYLTIFRAIFMRAFNDGIITTNPMATVKNHKVVVPVPEPFTKAEIAKLIVPNKDIEIEIALINVGLTTGLRISELLALTMESFNEAKKTLTIDLALVDGTFKCTKTNGSDRTLKLTEQGLKAMCTLVKCATTRKKTTVQVTLRDNKTKIKQTKTFLAFCSAELRRYKSVDDFGTTFFKPYCTSLGVSYRGASHLRHTFVSQMLTAGMPLKWIAKQLGHTSIKMVEKIYGKWIDEDAFNTDAEANLRMNEVLGIKGEALEKKVNNSVNEFDIHATILAEVQKTLRLVAENTSQSNRPPPGYTVARSLIRGSSFDNTKPTTAICSTWQINA